MVKRAPQPETTGPSAPAGDQVDPYEVARFLRPQPPIPVPPRTFAQPLPGLLAYTLLGNRVITRYQQG